MSHKMRHSTQTILVAIVSIAFAGCSCKAQDQDPVAEYLGAFEMDELLEIHLVDQVRDARNEGARSFAISALAEFYLEQVRGLDQESEQRARMLPRAWSFVLAYEGEELVELQIELLIDRYLPIEETVELHRLYLDSPNDRARASAQLVDIQRRFASLESDLQSEVSRIERRLRSAQSEPSADDLSEQLEIARRNLSLTRYYVGWTGYSHAVLNERRVTDETLRAFGWILGAKGRIPTMVELDRALLEFEHVSRAAIGAALCKAQNEEYMTARTWIKHILEDGSVSGEIRRQAQQRLLQIEAMDGQWMDVESILVQIRLDSAEPLQVSLARYLAIRSLEAVKSSNGFKPDAERIAHHAIEDLIKRGEIGHILDLQRRFGRLPLIANRFVSQYATALMELERANQATGTALFTTAANLFANALKSSDADQYPAERDDCELKLAYCSIKGGRSADAIHACDTLLDRDLSEENRAEALWLRVIAHEQLQQASAGSDPDKLAQYAVEYILAYPDSPNAARLLLRYGIDGRIDTDLAVIALQSIPIEDPASIAAHRMLVQLYHNQFRASGRTDGLLIDDAIVAVEWLWDQTEDEPADIADARSRLKVLRLVLDLTSARRGEYDEIVSRSLLRGLLLVEFDADLLAMKDEILLRRVEFLLEKGELDRAENQLDQMVDPTSRFALAALRAIFVSSIQDLDNHPKSAKSLDRMIKLGSALIESLLPSPPEPIGAELSAIITHVVRAAEQRGMDHPDPASVDLAYRLCALVLNRGQPDEDILRRTALLAARYDDPDTALEAWLRLLALYNPDEGVWYEARYESFALMRIVSPQRAEIAIQQYRVLHPDPGPEPWGAKIEALFGSSTTEQD